MSSLIPLVCANLHSCINVFCVSFQSTTHVVLASIKRTSAELGAFQRKLFKIDDHLGIGVSGLISDGRSISRFLRNECLSHRCSLPQWYNKPLLIFCRAMKPQTRIALSALSLHLVLNSYWCILLTTCIE